LDPAREAAAAAMRGPKRLLRIEEEELEGKKRARETKTICLAFYREM
jgi:hypothetical protein